MAAGGETEKRGAACLVCGGTDTRIFVEIEQVPAQCNALFETQAVALAAPVAPMHLAFCETCGHFFNAAFDPDVIAYSGTYENSLHFSPHFHEFAVKLAERIVGEFDLRQRRVIDVGCGRGDFLALLCEAGANHGFGFDPSCTPSDARPVSSGALDLRTAALSPEIGPLPADFVCCRHVLEHIQRPVDFIRDIRASIAPADAVGFYLEVPDAAWTVRDMGIWDLIYEHCSYFSASSLQYALKAAGCSVRSVEAVFGGQFLAAFGGLDLQNQAPTGASVEVSEETTAWVDAFAAHRANCVGRWRKRLDELNKRGDSVVIWGAGSKGITFLNVLRIGPETAPLIIDRNVRKHGKYVPGTGQRVAPPEALCDSPPALVIVMNPNYRDEIAAELTDLGLNSRVEVV